MEELQFFKKLFSYYFTLAFMTTIFVVVSCQFDIEILLNFIENCLFAVLISLPSYFIVNAKIRYFYDLLAFVLFSFTIFLESVYYLLFQVFFSASSIFVLMESNSNEAAEFVTAYIEFREILFIICFVLLIFYCLKTLRRVRPQLKPITRSMSVACGLTMLFLVLCLKFSKLIVYNFPYLFTKSVVEYYHTSKSFDGYSNNSTGSFTNIKTQNDAKNPVFVLIIGESTVRSHMQLYGYERLTTPRLSNISNDLLVYNDVISPHVLTVESIAKMLTLSNYEANYKPTAGTILQLANASNYSTFWLSNQRPIGVFESLITKIALSASQTKFVTTAHGQHNRTLDQVLLPELDRILSTANREPKFIVMHLMGAHFKYKNRYPDSLNNAFSPPNSTVKPTAKQMLTNQYDCAILNTDYVISEVVKSVNKYAKHSAVLYVSDHGEELDNLERRGHNEDFATKSMYDIPLLLWRSEEYKENTSLFFDANRPYMTDDLFHSLAQLLKIKANQVDSTRSIFSKYYQKRQRVILQTEDYDVKFNNQDPQTDYKR